MSFWSKALPFVGGPLIGTAALLASNAKDKRNAAIDSQMVNDGGPPGMLDPNDVGVPQPGGSAWARMQRGQNAMDASRAMDTGRQSAYGQLAGARSDLAARGGLSSGASERLAQGAMQNAGTMMQGNAADLSRANMGTNIEDERLRRGAYNQVRQQNQLMQGATYAGNQMSNATLNAARPQGLFGLGFLGL
jgi:hypothetical protein